tara:strand:- start:3805 stop:4407 length:603 start_codon:yes stop_codon:yes gene_type:complete
MDKEQLRMQMLAGIITESQHKQLLEDIEIINLILDKISTKGIDNLSPYEKEYLDAYAQEKELPPIEFLDNGTLRDVFFVSGDKDLELDKNEFTNYILTHKNKLKGLWNNSGGNWDQDQITDDELIKASDLFYQNYPKRYNSFFENELYLNDPTKIKLQILYWYSPNKKYFSRNIMMIFDENIENLWLDKFLEDINSTINS